MGPILIFDKSTLESLNKDEAALLDQFFLSNIVPSFLIETLADLEKAGRDNMSPEGLVGNLAYKTPDANAQPNVHFKQLLDGELLGHSFEMRGVPIIGGGREVQHEGRLGVVYEESPESQALGRWLKQDFAAFERSVAQLWRKAMDSLDFEAEKAYFKSLFEKSYTPTDLPAAYQFAVNLVDQPDQDRAFRWGLRILQVPHAIRDRALPRWFASDRKIGTFAPYFRHVLLVDVFFAVAIAAGLLREGDASHSKMDASYLYYLPFCMVFVSSDKLHRETAPLFLTSEQSFVWGPDLKADLAKLDAHYSALPQDVLDRGLYTFASKPPTSGDFLISQLWDKHFKTWKDRADMSPQPKSDESEKMIDKLKQLHKKAKESSSMEGRHSGEPDELMFSKRVLAKKGKWKRFPPEVMKSKPILD